MWHWVNSLSLKQNRDVQILSYSNILRFRSCCWYHLQWKKMFSISETVSLVLPDLSYTSLYIRSKYYSTLRTILITWKNTLCHLTESLFKSTVLNVAHESTSVLWALLSFSSLTRVFGVYFLLRNQGAKHSTLHSSLMALCFQVSHPLVSIKNTV